MVVAVVVIVVVVVVLVVVVFVFVVVVVMVVVVEVVVEIVGIKKARAAVVCSSQTGFCGLWNVIPYIVLLLGHGLLHCSPCTMLCEKRQPL